MRVTFANQPTTAPHLLFAAHTALRLRRRQRKVHWYDKQGGHDERRLLAREYFLDAQRMTPSSQAFFRSHPRLVDA